MFEPTEITHTSIERILSRVAERGVSQIMRKTDCLDQRFVDTQGARDCARDLSHLQ